MYLIGFFWGGDFLRFLSALSDLMVPVLIFYVVGLGLLMKQDVFGDFLNGAKDGDRKSTRLNSSHRLESRMPSSA